MKIESIQNADIDGLRELQPEGWTDIRPYFYFYSASDLCNPLKIVENNKIVAVGTTIQHPDTAWLAHIIVHPDFRNRGLGREIAGSLVQGLDNDHYRTIYLDATDMGYPVYKKLGFEVETDYIHLDGEYTDLFLNDPSAVIPYHERYRKDIFKLDLLVSDEDRRGILSDHLKPSLLYVENGLLRGAYFPSMFDGFILADNVSAGTELMKIRMRTKNTARFPAGNQHAVNFLLQNNYRHVRNSKRMIRGVKREWKADGIYNRISGGLG